MPTAKVQPEGIQDVAANEHPIQSRLSKAIISNSQWLAKGELYFTAFLSMSDMVSDIVMVVSLNSGAWGRRLAWGYAGVVRAILAGFKLLFFSLLLLLS